MKPRSQPPKPQRPTLPNVKRATPEKTRPIISAKTLPSITPRPVPTKASSAAKTVPCIKLAPLVKSRTEVGIPSFQLGKPAKSAPRNTVRIAAAVGAGVLAFLLVVILAVSARGPSTRPSASKKPKLTPTYSSTGNKRRSVQLDWHPEKPKAMEELDGKTMAEYMREKELDKTRLLVERQERVQEYESKGKRSSSKPKREIPPPGADDDTAADDAE